MMVKAMEIMQARPDGGDLPPLCPLPAERLKASHSPRPRPYRKHAAASENDRPTTPPSNAFRGRGSSFEGVSLPHQYLYDDLVDVGPVVQHRPLHLPVGVRDVHDLPGPQLGGGDGGEARAHDLRLGELPNRPRRLEADRVAALIVGGAGGGRGLWFVLLLLLTGLYGLL